MKETSRTDNSGRRVRQLENRVKALEHTLGTLVTWLFPHTLGQSEVEHLLDKLKALK